MAPNESLDDEWRKEDDRVDFQLKSGMKYYANFGLGREIGEHGPGFDRGTNSSLSQHATIPVSSGR